MRKSMLAAALLLLALLTAACGGGKGENTPNSHEQLALGYVNDFLNETSEEARNTYVQEHVHPEYQQLYSTDSPMPDGPIQALPLSNPEVYKSISDVQSEENGVAVWLKGEDNKEVIVLIIEGKVATGFDNYSGSMLSTAGFEPLQREFE